MDFDKARENISKLAEQGKPLDRGMRAFIGRHSNWAVAGAFIGGAFIMWLILR